MMKNEFWSLLLLSALLCGCSDDDGGGGTPPTTEIELSEGTPQKQEVFADETSASSKGISFTTNGAWKAVVEEVPASKAAQPADWVALSQYSGDKAGSYTLTVSLMPNFSGKERQAVIRIICGDSEITITIVQKGQMESGKAPRMVKKISYKEDFGKEAEYHWGKPENATFTYAYDERGRVVRIDCTTAFDGSDSYTFDYGVVGEITMTNKDMTGEVTMKTVATLDEAGRIVKLENPNDPDGYQSAYAFGYNEAGQLAKVSYLDKGAKGNWTRFDYTDGLMNKITEWWHGEETVTELPVDVLYPNRYPANLANIDLNFPEWFGDEELDLLLGMRLLGTGCRYLKEVSMLYDEDDMNSAIDPNMGYPNPNTTISKSYTYIKEPETGHDRQIYELDSEGYVTKFYSHLPYEIIKVTYEIVVGNELLDPNHPELGYRGEVRNRKETKVGEDKNTYTYTVEYVK